MRVLINGEPRELAAGATVSEAANLVGIEPQARGVAVALDGQVVPRAELGGTILEEGQRVEIVRAIQGG